MNQLIQSRREWARLFAFIAVIALAFLVLVYLHRALGLPEASELIELAISFLNRGGYGVVLVAALLEGMLLLGWYLPGSVVLTLAVIAAQRGPLSVPLVVGLIILGFFLTSLINYALGRYGWYRLLLSFGLQGPLERMRTRTEERGLKLVWVTYFHPNVGALTATSCGILRLPFRNFAIHSALATAAWNTLWGAVVYIVGDWTLKFLQMWVLLLIVAIWIAVGAILKRMRQRSMEV